MKREQMLAKAIKQQEEIWKDLEIKGLVDPFEIAENAVVGAVYESEGTHSTLLVKEQNYLKYRTTVEPKAYFPKHTEPKPIREKITVISGILSDKYDLQIRVMEGETYEYAALRKHSPCNNENESLELIIEFFR